MVTVPVAGMVMPERMMVSKPHVDSSTVESMAYVKFTYLGGYHGMPYYVFKWFFQNLIFLCMLLIQICLFIAFIFSLCCTLFATQTFSISIEM